MIRDSGLPLYEQTIETNSLAQETDKKMGLWLGVYETKR